MQGQLKTTAYISPALNQYKLNMVRDYLLFMPTWGVAISGRGHKVFQKIDNISTSSTGTRHWMICIKPKNYNLVTTKDEPQITVCRL